MDLKNTKPHDTYKGLLRQFNALKSILHSKEVQLNIYRQKMKEYSFDRVIDLESQLESEREMNASLTEELEKLINNYE